jgi:phosphate transport system permease protein
MTMNGSANTRDLILRRFARGRRRGERLVPGLLFLAASVSVLTTAGIVLILLADSLLFFRRVSVFEFFGGTELAPLAPEPKFGILPLLVGTLSTSLIAMAVAVPVGLAIAVYLSEYAPGRARNMLKPVLEALAGIPTIVYGFFAYSFVTPLLARLIPALEAKNALSPGIVMGFMIIPLIASLSGDAMSAVPSALREGALALGATRLEVTFRVVMPAALSGIIASFVLAVSRAVGETMIVAIAAGSNKTLTFDITGSMQTMTAYIVEFTSGDAASGTTGYYSLYAVGFTLFVFTLLMNMAARHLSRRFREGV